MKLSVVVPCYNEEKNIPILLERFGSCVPSKEMEVVIINNGSTDKSAEVLQKLIPQYPFTRLVTVPVNKGYGYGILEGLKTCKSDFIGWTHADMQTDPQDVIKALDVIKASKNKNLFVKGNRKGRPFLDRFFTGGMSFFESIYLKQQLSDINAQPNIFPKRFFEEWENPPYDFALDLYALYMARIKKLQIKRFNVEFPERIYGESHWNAGFASKWKFIKRTIDFSVKLKKKGIH